MFNYNVKVSGNIQDLTGEGLEYLIDQEKQVIGKFFNGNFLEHLPIDSESDTVIQDSEEQES